MNRDDGTYDWFAGWDILGDTLKKLVKKEDKVLYLGCGNSGAYYYRYRCKK